jgi:predicted PurR-regulated permease PerM
MAEHPPPVQPVVVPRWVQLVLLPLALVGGWALLRAGGAVVLLFTIAGLIALLLNPFVVLLRRAGFPRGPAVAATCIGVLVVLGGLGVMLANPVADQVSAFRENVPEIVDEANATLVDLQAWLDRNEVDLQITDPGRTALASLGDRVAEGSGELVNFTREALVRLVESAIAIILVVVLAVYFLLYGERIGAAVRRVVPRGDGTPEDDFPTRIQRAVFGYVRGQLLFSTIMGTSAGVMLWVLGSLGVFPDGRTYALFFGAFYGFAELIPYVGPAVGAAPPVLIATFSGEPLDALWLTIAFTGLQQIEGHIVAPQVFSQALRINPLLVIFALLMGGQLYGILGAFIALPIAAMIRETIVYARRHLVLEPWGTPSELSLAGTPAAAARGAPCPECATPRTEGAAFCHACGTELGAGEEEAAAAASAPR